MRTVEAVSPNSRLSAQQPLRLELSKSHAHTRTHTARTNLFRVALEMRFAPNGPPPPHSERVYARRHWRPYAPVPNAAAGQVSTHWPALRYLAFLQMVQPSATGLLAVRSKRQA
jgi:hypothetical protein